MDRVLDIKEALSRQVEQETRTLKIIHISLRDLLNRNLTMHFMRLEFLERLMQPSLCNIIGVDSLQGFSKASQLFAR